MQPVIRLSNATYHGFFQDIDLGVETSEEILLLTAHGGESDLLCQLFSGIKQLHSGKLTILGTDIDSSNSSEIEHIRRQVAVVPANGGLISNLKMWENITLPMLYHNGAISAETEKKIEMMIDLFNFSRNVMSLPATLTVFEKRITAFIRAIITEPSIMILSNIFDGLKDNEFEVMRSAANSVRNELKELAIICITSSDETVSRFDNINTVRMHNCTNIKE